MKNFRIWKYVTAILICLTIYGVVKGMIIRPWGAMRVDFEKHHIAARRVLDGESPYTGDDLYLSFNYPQFTAWFTLPFGFFKSVDNAETAWDVVNYILVILSAGIVVLGYRPRDKDENQHVPWIAAALFLSFFFGPNTSGLRPGNLSSWVLITMTILGWAVVRRKEGFTGVMIAICSLIKVLPVLLIIPYIFSRKKKVLIGAGAVYGVYFLALILTGALSYEWFYIREVLPKAGFFWRGVSHSVPYFMMRLFWEEGYNDPVILGRVHAAWALAVFIPFAALCWFRRDAFRTKRGGILIFICGTLLLPLLTPLLEYHHFIWAFPGLAAGLYLLYRGEMSPKYLPWLIFAFIGLSITNLLGDTMPSHPFSCYNLGHLFNLILYVVFLIPAWRTPKETEKN